MRISERFIEFRRYNSCEASSGETDRTDSHDLRAHTHAKPAENAFARVAQDVFVPGVFLRRRFLTRKALEICVVFVRIVYELAPVIVETAAFKASKSLEPRLLVSEPECDLVKAVLSLFCRENAHLFARDMFSVRKVALDYFALNKYRLFVAYNIPAKITVNNRRALLRFAYSGYGYVCALVRSVADCKNAVYMLKYKGNIYKKRKSCPQRIT